MRSKLTTLRFNIKCLWYLGCTPKQLENNFTNWALTFQPTPHPYWTGKTSITVSSNGWTNVQFYLGYSRVALNTTQSKGLVIQTFDPTTNQWTEMFRLQTKSLITGSWCSVIRNAVKARIKPRIKPTNESALGAFHE